MGEARQRLDKWLWFARFAKSRTLAAGLVSAGFVRVNGARAEAPAKAVRPGDVLTVAMPGRTALVRIVSCGERRGPAPEARTLYEEIGPRDDAALVTGPGRQ
ncbi:RNA-binding S4 domain-containing protein [Enterovirga sp.]|uniref:RNA-binding S4 domain-containing protein n=1 Tax=Enterovirga sp. TaxID=2026350 RepID=UPI0026095B2C|nr:RNA-binding S4 domain-containing protein [Enterovirga sp.]MDB5591119.1 RNA-binding domain protein [Enterovirga sp.]